MKRALVRVRAKELRWKSCTFIEEAYDIVMRLLAGKVTVKEIMQDIPDQQTIELLDELHRENTKVDIFFSSHVTAISEYIKALPNADRFHFIIPVYGDMTIEVDRWMKLSEVLSSHKVTILAASEASAAQLRAFIRGKDVVKVLPYPVLSLKGEDRRSEETMTLTYAGRISLGKNVLELMHDFALAAKLRPDLRLNICGEFTLEGHRFHGLNIPAVVLREHFKEALQKSENIHFLGNLNREELSEVMHGSDYFISMSTYHDEDFGVAAAEAMSAGCGLVLSAWGGHLSFKNAQTVSVNVRDDGVPGYSHGELVKVLLELKKTSPDAQKKNYKEHYSPEVVMAKFLSATEDSGIYEGQSTFFNEYANAFLTKITAPYRGGSKEAKDLHRKVYASYFGKN